MRHPIPPFLIFIWIFRNTGLLSHYFSKCYRHEKKDTKHRRRKKGIFLHLCSFWLFQGLEYIPKGNVFQAKQFFNKRFSQTLQRDYSLYTIAKHATSRGKVILFTDKCRVEQLCPPTGIVHLLGNVVVTMETSAREQKSLSLFWVS